jgi:formamidopyrimidine-DNA glycosylase
VPELPDLTVYQEHLAARIANRRLLRVRLLNPFLLRTAVPPVSAVEGKKVEALLRVGKRIVLALEGELYLESGALTLTEAGTKRRASLHLLQGKAALDAMDPGGIEVLESTAEDFATRLTRDNHTLKRALTDPRLFAGIGNAYSDESCTARSFRRSRSRNSFLLRRSIGFSPPRAKSCANGSTA